MYFEYHADGGSRKRFIILVAWESTNAQAGLKDIFPLWTCLSSPTDANDEDGGKEKGSLNLKDLKEMKPEYIST